MLAKVESHKVLILASTWKQLLKVSQSKQSGAKAYSVKTLSVYVHH